MKVNWIIAILVAALFGCSSQRQAATVVREPAVTAPAPIPVLASPPIIAAIPVDEDTSFIPDSTYDVIVTQYLESAREHYLDALEAREEGDSTRCVEQFEAAIADLNEVTTFPGIDTSEDFTDLTQTVLEDYERYIAVIDSLGPQTSIFALREKLMQMSDAAGNNPEQDTPRKVITTTTIPLVINGHVEEDMEFLRGRFKKHFEQWLHRAEIYLPTVRKIFKKEGAPEELVYLSFIESGVNPHAQSWAKAVGMWQFIKGTGALYGLRSNFWFDDRKDFIKASRAAARHLKDLHNEFGDWYLALGAYNAGPGRIYRAMRKSGETDFWKLRPYLPKETRNYVPLYIAATVMAMNPEVYGFEPQKAEAFEFDEVTINDCVDLSIIAKCAGTDVETIKFLNPGILRWCTPPGTAEFTLRVPKGSSVSFEEKYAAVPDDQKRNEIYHKVHRKETLASIARKYGVSASLLAEANKVSVRKKLKVGTILMIPVKPAGASSGTDIAENTTARSSRRAKTAVQKVEGRTGKDKLVYRIRKGDTLAEIAKRHGVRLSDLRVWNDIPYGKKIRAGADLTIWVPSSLATKKSAPEQVSNTDLAERNTATGQVGSSSPSDTRPMKITVRAGDNLRKIAKRYGVSVDDLKEWNNLKSDAIRKGQKLNIRLQEQPASEPVVSQKRGGEGKSSSASTTTYRVKKGDTLSAIASLFGVSVGDLRQWNNIRGNRIKVGQAIKINS